MRSNIGTLNALIRITCGFTILAWSTSKLVRHRNEPLPIFAAIMGALKVAEGITRFCPITYLYDENKHLIKNNNNTAEVPLDYGEGDDGYEVDVTVNPS
ncbi:DUF2892 domain-containing protein [Evansella sp. AB-rgal1]|uniref:YgaP family membrane protein n=1 Tax=Evansella sp. AB-rgal1 TaxID=3242696 RepID=UPI00359E46D9